MGCFDAEQITAARRDAANGLKLVEVDLGEYRITLPKLPGDEGGGIIDFHAFGQVTARDKASLEAELAQRAPEMRHRMLLAVRGLPETCIDEPELDSLRESVGLVVNQMLGDDVIQDIGFYEMSYYPM